MSDTVSSAHLDDLEAPLKQALQERRQAHLYRQRKSTQSAPAAYADVGDRQLLNFCSNDYLGLANHPEVVASFQAAANQFGVGSGASHLVCGHSHEHHALEEELATFLGRERVLLFSTGYMANMGAVNALVGRGDAIFEDKLNHASLLDAGLLSGAKFQRFLHNDPTSLQQRLARAGDAKNKLICVDGVFSMDGDLAPLPELAAIAKANQAWLMVDDAHGFGCLGEKGQGIVEHFGLGLEDVPVLMCTLGKGMGSFGAFVAGNEVLIESLIQFSRSYIYTTALPPAVAAASRASLRLLTSEAWRREKLQQLILRFRAGAEALGLPLMDSPTAIQPILLGDSALATAFSERLADLGFWVSAIRPPTVPEGTARLRVTLSASHDEVHVDQLLQALSDIHTSLAVTA
jgi:8-amino-7-oxononanoate synthase